MVGEQNLLDQSRIHMDLSFLNRCMFEVVKMQLEL